MYSFTICLLILVVGYFVYGRYVERVFGPEAKRPTPALTKADGVDYIPLPTWKIFMIQFLNIAGLGPIFGAIMGLSSGRPLIYGLSWGVCWRGLRTIIFRGCCRSGMEVKVCLRLSDVIWG